MTKTTRSTVMGAVLGLLAGGCGLGVLSKTPNPDAAPNTLPVKLTDCDPDNLAKPSCAQTCLDAQTIIQNDCVVCHETGALANLGNPADYHSLSNVRASSKYPGWVYVRPGDPDHSLIYKRIAIDGDMPPPSTIDSPRPRPSVSDFSVLREWIQSCIPDVPGYDAGTPPPPHDAGTDGAGPFVYVTCPASPPSGACAKQGMVCPYSTQTCMCDGVSWACQACPSAQPANGSACPATANQSTPVPFNCGYGNVSCNCVEDIGLNSSAWACGVCPAAQPSTGQACGNTPISCSYDQQQCDCIGGSWECLAPSCSVSAVPVPPRCSGFYSCDYPAIDQSCICSGTATSRADLSCSCPVVAPRNSSFCVPTEGPCVYSDQTCSCIYAAGWQCTQRCPDARPTDGSTCASSLNCSYGGGLCYCDGAAWHCS